MFIRIPIAFLAGLILYMIAMMMTTYDGILSLILQPIMGSIITIIALLSILIIGSPLLINAVWQKWRRIGIWTLSLSLLGFVSCVISWHPQLRVMLIHPETKQQIESFHPMLAIGGWLIVMFGILYCPAIGFKADRRWL